MFIVVIFGYKQQKIFTIDCLTATLKDCIWVTCINEILSLLTQKQEQHTKEMSNLNRKIQKTEQKLESVEQKIEEELKKELEAGQVVDDKKKKDDKKGKTSKKGKDQAPTNPLEVEKLKLTTEKEEFVANIEKYNQKLEKIVSALEKYKALQQNQDIIVELLDTAGERKFVKTKLDIYANEFLTDKNTYVLSTVSPAQTPDEEDVIQICELEGFAIRTCEEDKDAPPDEPLVVLQKDDKKKKKGGKK